MEVKFLDAITRKYPTLDEYWIIARRIERLEALARNYAPKKIVPIEADHSDENAYVKIADKLKTEQPLIKVLINNAGYERSGAFSSMQEKDILSMISVNIKGMTMMQRICQSYMQAGSFSIITCSVSAFSPVPNQAIYAASKKYVYYFGKALREELLAKKNQCTAFVPWKYGYGNESKRKRQTKPEDKWTAVFRHGKADNESIGACPERQGCLYTGLVLQRISSGFKNTAVSLDAKNNWTVLLKNNHK